MSKKLEVITGRNYLSYSSMSSWLECGKRFELERVYNAPQTGAWYFLGGNAVHKASEYLDLGETDDSHAAWSRAWAEELANVEPGTEIKAGGRKSKQWPDKENKDWWEYHGPQFVESWRLWTQEKFREGWTWLHHGPNDVPAIEVPVQFEFEDVLVKGYIDRVMVDPNGQVIVVDLKTGSREPNSSLQLAIYALGLQRNIGVTASLGGYWMARQGDIPTQHSLSHLTDELVGSWFKGVQTGIENEIFVPKVGPLCNSCSVQAYCPAVGGNQDALTRPTIPLEPVAHQRNVSQDDTNTTKEDA